MKRHCVPCETGCGQTDWHCPWCGRFTTPGTLPTRVLLRVASVPSDAHPGFHPAASTDPHPAVTMAELFYQ